MNRAAGQPSVDVSVVVPFRRSEAHLTSQLESLVRQEYEGTWEVVAVDNGSPDGSRAIAESFRGRLALRVVDAPERPGAGYARNVGAARASGSKLLFVDADDEVAPGYLAAMAAGLDRHEFVTSSFDHRSLNPEWVQAAYGPVWRDLDDPLPLQWGVLPFAGGSIGITREAFERTGGFPEDLPRMQDIAFSWEAQFAGVELGYVPDAVYRVRYRDTMRGLLRQGLAGGSTAPLLYRRYRDVGMTRRTVPEVRAPGRGLCAGSWRCARARTRPRSHSIWGGRSDASEAAPGTGCSFRSQTARPGTNRISGAAVSRPVETASRSVEVSVVMPFRDAADHIADQLEALAGQDVDREWELVLVDNGSTDESRAICTSFADRLPLRIVDASDRPGAAYATNLGVRHSTGSKLVFVDADDVVAPGYLSAIADALDRHDFVTTAFDHRLLNQDWVQRAHGDVWRDPDDPLFVQSGVLPFAGGSIGIARTVFEAVGGFPESFPRMYDIAFSWEVQFAGTSLHYVPDALYHVRYRDSLGGLFRQGLAGGSTAPLLYRAYRHAGMSRRGLGALAVSWLRLARNAARARSRAELAPLAVELGRQLGRLRGSLRYRVFFP